MRIEILSIIIAALATLFTGGSLLYTGLLHKSQKQYIKNQDKLNEIKLSKEAESKIPKIVVEIIPNSTGTFQNYYVLFTNIGGSDAINIDLKITSSRIWDIDLRMLPYEILKPGKIFQIDALNIMNINDKTLCNIYWSDTSGKRYEESAVLSK